MKKLLFILLIFNVSQNIYAQNVSGKVYESVDDKKNPLYGVNVYWLNSMVGTSTDTTGFFSVERPNDTYNKLIFSIVGYKKDTVTIGDGITNLDMILKVDNELGEVEIVSEGAGTHISRLDIMAVENITGTELKKAACCNLSESFETNASVDVNITDAVTGAKQIQLLGLSGTYTQIMVDNVPNLYGLAQPYGLTYIPGTWMNELQIAKGTTSVVDGYSSIAGQINCNTKDPDGDEIVIVNGLVNNKSNMELNFVGRKLFTNKLFSNLMFHANYMPIKHDKNHDGFVDTPAATQFNIFNKWKYRINQKSMLVLTLNGIYEDRKGGQTDFWQNTSSTDYFGVNVKTKRLAVMLKGGHEFADDDYSIAFKSNFIYHDQKSFFGHTSYNADELSFYFNTIFKGVFGDTSIHSYATGVSVNYDRLNEMYLNENVDVDDVTNTPDNVSAITQADDIMAKILHDTTMLNEEIVPGAFFEYTFHKCNWPITIVGLRADYHNRYGLLITPRLHVRYSPNDNNVFRTSVGKGYKTPHVFAENTSMFATAKKVVWVDDLNMEEAWNYGINYTHYFSINHKELTLNLSFYHTDFKHQAVVDFDHDYRYAYIYNLAGKSYSNVAQIDANYEPVRRLNIMLAFRWQDVKTTELGNILVRKPMVNRFKGLVNLSYGTRLNKWRFDYTLQINGDQRLPIPTYAFDEPESYDFESNSPVYCIMNAQVTKNFRYWNFYLGAENFTNYTQKNPIISADKPFSDFFDASRIWGPITGIKIYFGFRYILD